MAKVAAPEEDVIEIDEVCIRKSPSFWLWVAISRRVGQVLGFVVGGRTDASNFAAKCREMLARCWSDVPSDYVKVPIRTDGWGAYARFFPLFPPCQHEACPKGSGETSRAEGWNTKWPVIVNDTGSGNRVWYAVLAACRGGWNPI